jgi:16S rRNA C967 or C1407 C5-methylase (RsmB/RsmF family)
VSGQNPREIAVQVLQRRQGGEFVENLLETALERARLAPADRGLCQELVYGIVRWQATLDWLIARKARTSPPKPLLQDLLRLGLYQIFWLDRIPNHAAVNETVELAKRNRLSAQAGFINAVLRGYLREFDATKQLLADLKAKEPHIGYSHPEWLVQRWQNRWGNESTLRLLEWNNSPPKTFARVNTLKADPGKLLTQWRDENVEYDFVRIQPINPVGTRSTASHSSGDIGVERVPTGSEGRPMERSPLHPAGNPPLPKGERWGEGEGIARQPTVHEPAGAGPRNPGFMERRPLSRSYDWLEENLIFELKSHPPLARLPSFQQGLFYVQDPSTLLAVKILDPKPGETILDLCAAPGGKLTYIAQRMNNEGKLVAHDLSPDRLELVEENCARLGVSCVQQVLPSTLNTQPSKLFDRILIDAPCSNTGVMRRRVDLRWRIEPEEISRLRAMQLNLLKQAALILRSGGALVYSTCSMEPEENRQVISEFLSSHPKFKLDFDRELLPFADAADGAYVSRIT